MKLIPIHLKDDIYLVQKTEGGQPYYYLEYLNDFDEQDCMMFDELQLEVMAEVLFEKLIATMTPEELESHRKSWLSEIHGEV